MLLYIYWLIGRIIPFLLRCRKEFNKSPIIVLTTIVLAIFAGASIYQTHSIISQQNNEELIRLRAYIHLSDFEIRKSSVDSEFDYEMHMNIKNGGETPAKLFINKAFINDKEIEFSKNNLGYNKIFGPDEADVVVLFFKDKYIQKDNLLNYFLVEFKYGTYRNDSCYLYKTTGNFSITPIPNRTFFISSQDDIPTPCNK